MRKSLPIIVLCLVLQKVERKIREKTFLVWFSRNRKGNNNLSWKRKWGEEKREGKKGKKKRKIISHTSFPFEFFFYPIRKEYIVCPSFIFLSLSAKHICVLSVPMLNQFISNFVLILNGFLACEQWNWFPNELVR